MLTAGGDSYDAKAVLRLMYQHTIWPQGKFVLQYSWQYDHSKLIAF